MRTSLATSILIWTLTSTAFLITHAADKAALDVLGMREIPSGFYDVELQYEGKSEIVKLSFKNNRGAFVQSNAAKLEGRSGKFDFIGNGVFMARLSSQSGAMTQWWIFHPDGSASLKEIPDRGEKETAKRSTDQ